MVVETKRSISASVVILLLVLFLYIEIRYKSAFSLYMIVILLLGVLRLLIIPAFGEILHQWYAEVSARPPLSSTHYGPQRLCSARVSNRSAAAVSSAYGHQNRLAGVIRLLYAGRAVKEEP